jgi:hypothetical protein
MAVNIRASSSSFPSELLISIIGFVDPCDEVSFTDADRQGYRMPTLLLLRMVNHLFRQLVLTHPFWRDSESDFDSLVSKSNTPPKPVYDFPPHSVSEHRPQFETQFRRRMLFEFLLHDRDFSPILLSRTHWTLLQWDIRDWILAAISVSGGKNNIQHLTFEIRKVAELYQVRNYCPAVKSLHLILNLPTVSTNYYTDYEPTFDLGHIGQNWPCLEHLSLKFMRWGKPEPRYRDHQREFDLCNLKSFSCTALMSLDPSEILALVPTSSNRTLTSLRHVLLEEYDDPHQLQRLESAFQGLVNLKEYVGIPISKSILNILSSATFSLDRLEIYLEAGTVVRPLIHAIHTAPSLRHLKTLFFRANVATQLSELFPSPLPDRRETRPVMEDIETVLEAITATLAPTLQNLHLNVPLYMPWCRYFGRLRSLKRLEWGCIPSDEQFITDLGLWYPRESFVASAKEWESLPDGNFDNAMKTAFADLTEKPTVWLDSRRVL